MLTGCRCSQLVPAVSQNLQLQSCGTHGFSWVPGCHAISIGDGLAERNALQAATAFRVFLVLTLISLLGRRHNEVDVVGEL